MATEAKTPEQIKQELHGKLMKKMSLVIKATGNVEKKGKNKEQGYAFATHSDIIEELRKHIADNGIFILPRPETWSVADIQSRSGSKGALISMTMDFEIIDTETGYSVSVHWFGQGMDYGDKAMYKSYTGALKYFLLDTFMISTGDDPEKESPEEAHATTAQPKPAAAPVKPRSVMDIKPMALSQKASIISLLGKKGKTKADLEKWTLKVFKKNFVELTMPEAAATIKNLEKLEDLKDPTDAFPPATEDVNPDEVAAGIDAEKKAEEKAGEEPLA